MALLSVEFAQYTSRVLRAWARNAVTSRGCGWAKHAEASRSTPQACIFRRLCKVMKINYFSKTLDKILASFPQVLKLKSPCLIGFCTVSTEFSTVIHRKHAFQQLCHIAQFLLSRQSVKPRKRVEKGQFRAASVDENAARRPDATPQRTLLRAILCAHGTRE